MSAISKDEVVELLTKEIERLDADEVNEVHADVFREPPVGTRASPKDTTLLVKRLIDYLNAGLDPDVIEYIWDIIFPLERRVAYDEEDGLFHATHQGEPSYSD